MPTFYIAPSGTDTPPPVGGTSTTPWRTWAFAFANSNPGDTLIVQDGTYTRAVNGVIALAKFCTITTPYIIQAQNSRQPLIQDDGAGKIIHIYNSSYITLNGLRIRSIDNSAFPASQNLVQIGADSVDGFPGAVTHHITIKNNIFSHNNRYGNTALLTGRAMNDSLWEGNEFYDYHRHACNLGRDSHRNVVRLNYANSRNRADISGGFPSGWTSVGDSGFIHYTTGGTTTAADNIFENNISEGNGNGFDVEAVNGPHRNKFVGNISLNDQQGVWLRARSTTLLSGQPVDCLLENNVIITPAATAFRLSGNRNTLVKNCTIYDGAAVGFLADVEADPATGTAFDGAGTVSVFGTNILTILNTTGVSIVTTHTNPDRVIDIWTMTNVNAFGNTTNFSPASSNPNYVSPTTINPNLGAVRCWIPDASPMKGIGVGGADVGANILYRYASVPGTGTVTLSATPLWDLITGEFPHGAIIGGVNDTPTTSCYNVHTRLGIDPAQFPAGYGGVPDTTPPAIPTGLTVT